MKKVVYPVKTRRCKESDFTVPGNKEFFVS